MCVWDAYSIEFIESYYIKREATKRKRIDEETQSVLIELYFSVYKNNNICSITYQQSSQEKLIYFLSFQWYIPYRFSTFDMCTSFSIIVKALSNSLTTHTNACRKVNNSKSYEYRFGHIKMQNERESFNLLLFRMDMGTWHSFFSLLKKKKVWLLLSLSSYFFFFYFNIQKDSFLFTLEKNEEEENFKIIINCYFLLTFTFFAVDFERFSIWIEQNCIIVMIHKNNKWTV